VFSASPDIIMVWDFPSESTVWTNRPIPALLGYSQQDIATTDDVPGRLIYREDQARFDAAMVAAHEADTGRGIAPHDFPRLFLPFDRIDADVNHIQGIGLGLTLSRDLMTAMGGTLAATSQEGIGSIFTASLPLTPTDGDHERPKQAVDTRPILGTPTTVLYIEDNSTNVGLLEQILAYRPNVTLRVALLGRVGWRWPCRTRPT